MSLIGGRDDPPSAFARFHRDVRRPAVAAITPSWRINPIPSAAIANDPQLAAALSVSLLIELSGGSQWHQAGLAFDVAAVLSIYNHPLGSSGPPNPSMVALFPALAFDSYIVGTPMGPYQADAPATPTRFNVQWGPPPLTSGEIARFTVLGATIGTPVVLPGEVRASDAPGVAVALPPLPIVGLAPIPEPRGVAQLASAGIAGVLARRRRRPADTQRHCC